MLIEASNPLNVVLNLFQHLSPPRTIFPKETVGQHTSRNLRPDIIRVNVGGFH